jgi:zinc D-Ala-D-Ala carboxypeptidase
MSAKLYISKTFKCKCGCNGNIKPEVVSLCNKIYQLTDRYYPVNSGFRCIRHNENIGGSPTSSHCRGYAVDLAVEDSSSRYKLIKALINLNICRFGVYNWGVHLDIDPDKDENVCWIKG